MGSSHSNYVMINDKISVMDLFAFFHLTEAGRGSLKDGEGNGITWTSSLDRKIQNLQDVGKEKYSLKRLKHLHQEKVLM